MRIMNFIFNEMTFLIDVRNRFTSSKKAKARLASRQRLTYYSILLEQKICRKKRRDFNTTEYSASVKIPYSADMSITLLLDFI